MTACMRARKAPWNVGFWHIGPQVNAAQCPELAEADVGDRCAHRIEPDCRAERGSQAACSIVKA
jgi:hypothetical protein